MNWKLGQVGHNPTTEQYLVFHKFGHKVEEQLENDVDVVKDREKTILDYQAKLRSAINAKNLKLYMSPLFWTGKTSLERWRKIWRSIHCCWQAPKGLMAPLLDSSILSWTNRRPSFWKLMMLAMWWMKPRRRWLRVFCSSARVKDCWHLWQCRVLSEHEQHQGAKIQRQPNCSVRGQWAWRNMTSPTFADFQSQQFSRRNKKFFESLWFLEILFLFIWFYYNWSARV